MNARILNLLFFCSLFFGGCFDFAAQNVQRRQTYAESHPNLEHAVRNAIFNGIIKKRCTVLCYQYVHFILFREKYEQCLSINFVSRPDSSTPLRCARNDREMKPGTAVFIDY